jgi:hypothetical protein
MAGRWSQRAIGQIAKTIQKEKQLNYSLITKTAAGALLVGVLAACGGGTSGVATAPVTPAAPTTFTVAGTAATGAPFAGATVTIIGSDGTTYGGGATDITGADGAYTIVLPLTAKPPFVVQAATADQTLISVVAEAKDTTTNITPVTNLIASRLSTSGNPANLAAEIQANPALVDTTKLTAKVAEIVALIQPLRDAAGDTTDPLNGKLVADGTGADKVLDSLSISITPSSATSVNIEVSVKQKQAEGEQPAVIGFSGGANATAPAAALPTVSASDLVPSGTATLIADLLKRMTACYALAQTDRVASGGTAAADIKAAACKDLFVGNDPASFKNNGAVVSSNAAWSSLFNPNAAGVTFDRGSYEFTRANGDLVIAYRATDASGNSTNNTLVVKADTDGKLRAIGNQYKYNGAVNAYQQLRSFINQPAADYYSTGYNLNVNSTADVSNVVKIVVTSPNGKTLLLKPSSGSAYFPLVKVDPTSGAETMTGTNFVRLARQYLDTANSGDPALADTGVFFSADRWKEADILAIPAQARWKFEYYLAGQTTPDATQYFTTRARAMTIAELQTQPLANMADAFYAEVKAGQTAVNGTYYVAVDPADPAQLSFDWVVPTGALAPTSIQVYGNYVSAPSTRSSFNDKTGVKSTARSGIITCSSGGSGDTHCDSAGNYVATDRFNGVHLWAEDAAGRDFAHFYAIYTVTIVP